MNFGIFVKIIQISEVAFSFQKNYRTLSQLKIN